jgi:hypothetical protein
MKLVPQGGVITPIRGVPDEMGRKWDRVAFFYPGHKDKRGELEGEGRTTRRVCFLNFLVGPLVDLSLKTNASASTQA